MKIKAKITVICVLALALVAAGCTMDNGVTPAPSVRPSLSASPALTVTPDNSVAPAVSSSPVGTPDNMVIEGFKEGDSVDMDKLPDAVTKAVKAKYPDATIKSATYATYENQQMYKLVLQNAGDSASEQCYVKADGTIVPYTATATDDGSKKSS